MRKYGLPVVAPEWRREAARLELARVGLEACDEPEGPHARFGGFAFVRGSAHWTVSGLMPLEVATAIYEHPVGRTDVRAGGDCAARPPETWAKWVDAEGREVVASSERRNLTGLLLETYEKVVGDRTRYVEAEDPSRHPGTRRVVDVYDVDTELGLQLVVDAIRMLRALDETEFEAQAGELSYAMRELAGRVPPGPWRPVVILSDEEPTEDGRARVRTIGAPLESLGEHAELGVGAIAGDEAVFLCRGMMGPRRAASATFLAACGLGVPALCDALDEAILIARGRRAAFLGERQVMRQLRTRLEHAERRAEASATRETHLRTALESAAEEFEEIAEWRERGRGLDMKSNLATASEHAKCQAVDARVTLRAHDASANGGAT